MTKARNLAVLVPSRAALPRGATAAAQAAGPMAAGWAWAEARRPGATGHSSSTQARNPASVDAGAMHKRSSHKNSPPATASMLTSSTTDPPPTSRREAVTLVRMTPISVSLASA
jgi:hypothetical protein